MASTLFDLGILLVREGDGSRDDNGIGRNRDGARRIHGLEDMVEGLEVESVNSYLLW